MARIRSIKPELRTSLTVAAWEFPVRYLWVLLWGYLDDHGRGVDDARLIKADCLPLDDDVSAASIELWLKIMATGPDAPLCRYESGGRRYLHAKSWTDHQRPSHPKDSRLPACRIDHSRELPETFAKSSGELPANLATPAGNPPVSVSAGQGFAKSSGSPREGLAPEVEVEQVVRGGDVEVLPPAAAHGAAATEETAQTVLAAWIDYCATSNVKLGRLKGHYAKGIKQALDDGFPPELIKRALASMLADNVVDKPSWLANRIVATQTGPERRRRQTASEESTTRLIHENPGVADVLSEWFPPIGEIA